MSESQGSEGTTQPLPVLEKDAGPEPLDQSASAAMVVRPRPAGSPPPRLVVLRDDATVSSGFCVRFCSVSVIAVRPFGLSFLRPP